MKFNKTKSIISLGLISILLLSASAYAQPLQFEDPLNNSGASATTVITDIIFRIVRIILGIAASLAALVIIVTGVRYMLGALGSEQEIAKAKQMLLWAIIGLMIIGLAAVILWTVRYILGITVVPAYPL